MRNIFLLVVVLLLIGIGVIYKTTKKQNTPLSLVPVPTILQIHDPLQIIEMRKKQYPASPITIEKTLENGSDYTQYITSYLSDGLKIYALLTIPNGEKPKEGWPVIIFNHGYIPPEQYQTTVRYESYVDAFARNGYIVFKPDYRGNGDSQGSPQGAYYSPAYTVDVLNALSSIAAYKDANAKKIGMWGHSMGGNITLRSLVIRPDAIKAAVIWGGVVGTYEQLTHWHDPSYRPSAYELGLRNRYRTNLEKKYGSPSASSPFWYSIDPTNFVSAIQAPIQLHQSEGDEEVPASFSATLVNILKKQKKPVEFYLYPGDNHNISEHFSIAMQRSIDFFDTYLKNR